jgi:hypothetical protein
MVDIRYPIGMMFTILGVLIGIYGFVTTGDSGMYEKSLNVNVNIYSGLLMLVFGLIMLYFARRRKKIS